MITIEIPKRELLRQLPEGAGSALIQWYGELPSVFRFEVLPIRTVEHDLHERYPEFWNALTGMEQRIITIIFGQGRVPRNVVFSWMYKHQGKRYVTEMSNVVDVHLKNIRYKIEAFNVPFVITSKRGVRHMGAGTVEIKEKK